MSLKILLVSLGTAGDVHPFVGLGVALSKRGHRVTVMTNEHFEPLVRRHGFDFVATGTNEEFRQAVESPKLWHRVHGPLTLARFITQTMPVQFEAIRQHYEPGNTVVAAYPGAFGARVAQEKLGVPLATVALQPSLFRSYYKAPVLAGFPSLPDWLPRLVKTGVFRVLDGVADFVLSARTVNAFRADLGLPPVNRLIKDWWLSPQLVLGLYPDWYAMLQPDWPEQFRTTGFPMYDERREGEPLPKDVEEFLDSKSPPIVFTPGSGMLHGDAFFAAAVEACGLLQRRGILLTRYPRQIPQNLPESVRHFDYVPFSQVLPRCSAIVHHGGIGTIAQALAAGIPQLLMPMSFDQPDNARRIGILGVGDHLVPKKFRGPSVAAALERLIGSAEVRARCRGLSAKIRAAEPVTETCMLIEDLIVPTH